MPDGFQLGSGVQRGGQRINPEGVNVPPSAAIPIPTNVPLVAPVNDSTTAERDNGALSLASAIGNIDFGALTRGYSIRADAARKLKEEQDKAAGQSEAALMLSQTGGDYNTLIQAGVIPASASPAFRLGASIAASQAALNRLRKDVMLRAAENPNAPIFTEDAEFMAKHMNTLRGVRSEAVSKYFLEPLDAIATDDTTRFIKAKDEENKITFMGDAISTFENAISMKDEIGPALNNAINTLKLGNHQTAATMKALITAAGPQILEASRDKNGRVDMAKAGMMLREVGNTKVKANGGQKLSLLFTEAFEALEQNVYGSVTRAAQADKAQDEAHQSEGIEKFGKWLGVNMSKVGFNEAMAEAARMGLEFNTAMNLYKGVDGAAGVKSKEEVRKTNNEANYRAEYNDLTPSQRKEERSYLTRAFRDEKMDGEEYNERMQALDHGDDDVKPKAPISSSDRTKITNTLYNQMSVVFGSPNRMQAAMLGATSRYGLSGSQSDTVRHKVAERLGDIATSWMMQQPEFSDYLAASENVANDQAMPGQIITRLTERFLQQNGPALSKLIPQALASRNPDSALSSLKLGQPSSIPSKPKRDTGGGSKRPPSGGKNPAKSSAPPKPTPSPAQKAQAAARMMATYRNPKSKEHQWWASKMKAMNPKTTDIRIIQQIQSLTPVQLEKYHKLYLKETQRGR